MFLKTFSSHFFRLSRLSVALIMIHMIPIPQRLGVRIVDVVLFCDLVQTIDERMPAFQVFFQMRPATHLLIPWSIQFLASLVQRFLNVYTPSSSLGFSSFLPHHLLNNWFLLNRNATFYPVPNLPNWVGLSNV